MERTVVVGKRLNNRQSKSFYIEIIIAIVFLSIVAAVVMMVYSRTNHIIYINELENEATSMSRSYIECLKSGMDIETAIEEVFVNKGYSSERISSQEDLASYKVENDDVKCEIVLKYTHGKRGVYTKVNIKFTSYFGELYEFNGGVYNSVNEIRR